jgi:ubiquinone biosynthesis monooxygenase Coq7
VAFIDKLIGAADNGIKTVFAPATASRPTPAEGMPEAQLSASERAEAGRLMRVNHCGEVCAQALYQGQALFAREGRVAEAMQESAREEIDHLAWTANRLHELGARQSALNPLWYGASFCIGAAAALVSDKISLGFVAETESQVSRHLQSHLQRLPAADAKSRAIVEQMDIDEQEHASNAITLGAAKLPAPVAGAMRLMGRVMTKTSYWL